MQEAHSGRTTGYRYDELYRLTGETITDPVNGNYSAEYQFDKVGNRTCSIINGVHTAYSYDHNDRLTQQGGVSYSYDASGNTLTETEDGWVNRFHYNAFGVLLNSAGDTANVYRYTGEQLDQSLDQCYLRARYYDQGVGRFTQQDTWMGITHDPITFHKYLYGNADPVNGVDPSGNMTLTTSMGNISMMNTRSIQQSKVDRRIIVLNTFH